jgi:hypothetical protein
LISPRFPSSADALLLLDHFRGKCAAEPQEAVLDWLFNGEAEVLDAADRTEVRDLAAATWHCDPSEVYFRGSARLGFGLYPKTEPPAPAGRPFSPNSDIDLAVVNGTLFDRIWLDMIDSYPMYKFKDIPTLFPKYLYQGWFRWDQLPRQFHWRHEWGSRCRTLSDAFGQKASVAVIKDLKFLHHLALKDINKLRTEIT